MSQRKFVPTPYTFEDLSTRAAAELLESEKSAELANRRRVKVASHVVTDLTQRHANRRNSDGPSEAEVDSVTNTRCAEDPVWKAHVGSNRWHLDQATAYGIAALVASERDVRARLKVQAVPITGVN